MPSDPACLRPTRAASRYALLLIILFASLLRAQDPEEASPARFRIEVAAVLSKAGCNSGRCHGNRDGKGGFRLSLRGEDPQYDYLQIARAAGGRRINRLEPAESLLLLKPTGSVAHEGGTRFHSDSLEYRTLRDWVASGARESTESSPRLMRLSVSPSEAIVRHPAEEFQMRVTAEFADGSRRDVTKLAVYEVSNLNAEATRDGLVQRVNFGETTVIARFLNQQVPVMLAFLPQSQEAAWEPPPENNYIDQLVFAKLRRLGIPPSPLCDDLTFLRRAYLDVIGLLPTAAEAQAFLADSLPDKRQRLIDRLLMRPEFAEFWAVKWSDILRNEEKVLDPKGVGVFYAWIRDSLATGRPLDQFVRELLTGQGSTYEIPPANYYRANRDPLTRAENTARSI